VSQQTDNTDDFRQTMSANFALMARIRGDFSVEQLNGALERIRGRHPVLFQKMPKDGSSPVELNLDATPIFPLEVLKDCGETDWIEIASAELQRPFPPDGPFARFTLLRLDGCSDLVASFHHWGCDGMSGVYVIRDILRLLGEPAAELPPAPFPVDISTLIPKAVTQKLQTRLRVWAAVAKLRMFLFLKHLRKPGQPEKAVTPRELSQEELALRMQVCILPHSLSAAQTAALVARCRAERTSVHAAICVAWLTAFAQMLEGRQSWTRTASSPVNIRQRLTPPIGDTSGPYLAIVETEVNCAPGRDFWQVSREFKNRLNRDSDDARIFLKQLKISSIIAQFPRPESYEAIGRLFRGRMKYDFSITNLGQLDFPAQFGPLHIDAFYGPLVNSGERERTVGVSTLAGKMTLTLLFRRSRMDPARAEQLMERAIGLLVRAAGW